ncbi:hypothetical protein ACFXAF_23840 [Kitasatospora sp. NPDC059463]|uniref:hypothetical protein n=1 Tax=unclassified Kitasatospora TaxID=2633591 RepID=UPI003695A46D
MEGWLAPPRRRPLRHLDSLLKHHLYPAFRSRRMGTFDHKVVEAFIQTMEPNGVGLATQSNAFDKLKSILLDAHRLGLYNDSLLDGVKPRQYDPKRAVIPSPTQLRDIRSTGDDTFLLVADLMSGCGMRNGEALAVNINNVVADDVYRITEQVNRRAKTGTSRCRRAPGSALLSYTETYGTVDGYLRHHPRDLTKPFSYYNLQNQWEWIKRGGDVDIPDA